MKLKKVKYEPLVEKRRFASPDLRCTDTETTHRWDLRRMWDECDAQQGPFASHLLYMRCKSQMCIGYPDSCDANSLYMKKKFKLCASHVF